MQKYNYTKMPYQDPKNKEELINKLKQIKDENKIRKLIDTTFPGWIVGYFDSYSEDYPMLDMNWRYMCKIAKTEPQKIILVDFIEFSEDHTILQEFADMMTKNGYCVRRSVEFTPCEVCNKAIPNKKLWQQFKFRNIPTPGSWSKKCKTC